MKPIILKESEISEEETLDHCLTAIQGLLDMDDYSQAYKYLYGFTKCLIDQTREETIKEVEYEINKFYTIRCKNCSPAWFINETLNKIKLSLNNLKQ